MGISSYPGDSLAQCHDSFALPGSGEQNPGSRELLEIGVVVTKPIYNSTHSIPRCIPRTLVRTCFGSIGPFNKNNSPSMKLEWVSLKFQIKKIFPCRDKCLVKRKELTFLPSIHLAASLSTYPIYNPRKEGRGGGAETFPKRMTVIISTIPCPKRKKKTEPVSFQSNVTPVENHSRSFCSHGTFWGL